MKKKTFFGQALIISGLLLIASITRAQSDPYANLKKVAQARDSINQSGTAIDISMNSSVFKSYAKKTAIPFTPLPMRDQLGRAISPNQMVTLPDGRQVTAAVYYGWLNETMQKINRAGYATIAGTTIVTGEIVTPVSTLSGQVNSLPKPIGKYKTPAELKNFMNPTVLNISSKTVVPKLSVPLTGVPANELHSLKVINETYNKDYSFGSASTFLAAVHLGFNRYANVKGTDQQHPSANGSEYRISGAATIYASVFSHPIDVFRANGSFEAPADPAKKLNLSIHANVLGTSILNISEQFSQRQSIAGSEPRNFDKNMPFSVPVIPGVFSLSGQVGIKGTVGYEYSGILDHTLVSAEFRPFADITGYAEGGVSDPFGFFSAGIGGSLTFVQGDARLSGSFGIADQAGAKIWLSYVYNVEYDLNFLKGHLYAYADAPFGSYHTNIFSWSGGEVSGTFADGRFLYNIFNGSTLDQPLTQ